MTCAGATHGQTQRKTRSQCPALPREGNLRFTGATAPLEPAAASCCCSTLRIRRPTVASRTTTAPERSAMPSPDACCCALCFRASRPLMMGDVTGSTPPDEREERARRWRALQSTTAPSTSPPPTPPAPEPVQVPLLACSRCQGLQSQLADLTDEFSRLVLRLNQSEADKVTGRPRLLSPWHCRRACRHNCLLRTCASARAGWVGEQQGFPAVA